MTVERLIARAESQDLLYRWCRAVDRCDWDAIRGVFHPDGHDDHGIYSGDVDGLIAWLSVRSAVGDPCRAGSWERMTALRRNG